jgi:hypothetical protein
MIFQVPPEGLNIFISWVIVILSSRNLLDILSVSNGLIAYSAMLRHSVENARCRWPRNRKRKSLHVIIQTLFSCLISNTQHETIYHPVLCVFRKWRKSCTSGIAATSKDYGILQFVVWIQSQVTRLQCIRNSSRNSFDASRNLMHRVTWNYFKYESTNVVHCNAAEKVFFFFFQYRITTTAW